MIRVSRRPHRRTPRRLGVLLSVATLLAVFAPATPVAAATDRLPDLRSAPIRDLRITRTSSGRKLHEEYESLSAKLQALEAEYFAREQ